MVPTAGQVHVDCHLHYKISHAHKPRDHYQPRADCCHVVQGVTHHIMVIGHCYQQQELSPLQSQREEELGPTLSKWSSSPGRSAPASGWPHWRCSRCPLWRGCRGRRTWAGGGGRPAWSGGWWALCPAGSADRRPQTGRSSAWFCLSLGRPVRTHSLTQVRVSLPWSRWARLQEEVLG